MHQPHTSSLCPTLTEEPSRGDTSSSESGMLSNGDRFSESALSKISVRAVSSDTSFWSSRDNLLCSGKKIGRYHHYPNQATEGLDARRIPLLGSVQLNVPERDMSTRGHGFQSHLLPSTTSLVSTKTCQNLVLSLCFILSPPSAKMWDAQ